MTRAEINALSYEEKTKGKHMLSEAAGEDARESPAFNVKDSTSIVGDPQKRISGWATLRETREGRAKASSLPQSHRNLINFESSSDGKQ